MYSSCFEFQREGFNDEDIEVEDKSSGRTDMASKSDGRRRVGQKYKFDTNDGVENEGM